VEEPDRHAAHLGVADQGGIAGGVERNVGRECHFGIEGLLEPFETRIERGLAAAREAHEGDPATVDARMRGQDIFTEAA
jgi:hypothetical protein